MTSENLSKLIDRAGEMALRNMWEEKAYKINMAILKYDNNNFAACTRLAKYYKLSENIQDAKVMYMRALEINPESQGVKNNLNEIQREADETKFVSDLTTCKELFSSGQKLTQKGNHRLAMKCYFKAFNMEPVLKHGVNLAKSYNKLGQQNEIKNLYKELIKNNSSIDVINNIKVEFDEILKNKKVI
jgi:tetratricopeptide (TPR) repeat protein